MHAARMFIGLILGMTGVFTFLWIVIHHEKIVGEEMAGLFVMGSLMLLGSAGFLIG